MKAAEILKAFPGVVVHLKLNSREDIEKTKHEQLINSIRESGSLLESLHLVGYKQEHFHAEDFTENGMSFYGTLPRLIELKLETSIISSSVLCSFKHVPTLRKMVLDHPPQEFFNKNYGPQLVNPEIRTLEVVFDQVPPSSEFCPPMLTDEVRELIISSVQGSNMNESGIQKLRESSKKVEKLVINVQEMMYTSQMHNLLKVSQHLKEIEIQSMIGSFSSDTFFDIFCRPAYKHVMTYKIHRYRTTRTDLNIALNSLKEKTNFEKCGTIHNADTGDDSKVPYFERKLETETN